MLSRIAILWVVFAAVMGFAVGGSFVSSFGTQHQDRDVYTADTGATPQTDENQPTKSIGERFAVIWERTWADPVAFYTFVLSIFTALLAIVSGGQGWFLYRADKATYRALVLSQRPKLRVRNVVASAGNPALVHRLGLFQANQFVTGQLFAVNVGGTPAHITDSHCIAFWSEAGLPMRRPYEGQNGNGAVPFVRLIPGQSVPTQFRSDEPMIEHGRTIGSQVIRALRLFVMGWIEYRDDVGVLRRTAFCREFTRGPWDEGRFSPVDNPDYEHEE